jgi:undecaprenyl-diphosphatase
MLLPVVLGATLLKAMELVEAAEPIAWGPLLIGTFVAYVSGVLAIRAMIQLVTRGTLHYFAFYCFAIGTIGLIFI